MATHPTSLGIMLPRRHRAGNAAGSNGLGAAAPWKGGELRPPGAQRFMGCCRHYSNQPQPTGTAVTGSQEPPDPLSQERFWISAPNILWTSLEPSVQLPVRRGGSKLMHGHQLWTPVIHSAWRAI